MKNKTKYIYDHMVFWASCAAYVFLFLLICMTYAPGSVLHSKYATPHIVATLYPEKWDFYTGTANGPAYRMYTTEGGKLIPYELQPFTGRFLFGLKRDGKIIASELELIATDTPFISVATKYVVKMPLNGDINNYIHADTLKYNNYHSENVLYLHGRVLLGMEECPTWQDRRAASGVQRSITLVPLNLTTGP